MHFSNIENLAKIRVNAKNGSFMQKRVTHGFPKKMTKISVYVFIWAIFLKSREIFAYFSLKIQFSCILISETVSLISLISLIVNILVIFFLKSVSVLFFVFFSEEQKPCKKGFKKESSTVFETNDSYELDNISRLDNFWMIFFAISTLNSWP